MIWSLKRFLLLCSASLLFISSLMAGPLGHLSPFINIPVAETFDAGTYSISSIWGINSKYSHNFDFMFDYAYNDEIKFGIHMVDESNFAGHFHFTFLERQKFVLASGLSYISSKDDIDARGVRPTSNVKKNAYSPYATMQFRYNRYEFHTGYGNNYFASSISEKNGAFFGGFGMKFKKGKLMFEYDGKSTNVGWRFKTKNTHITLALTEFSSNDPNPEFRNTPIQFLTIGFKLIQEPQNPYYNQRSRIVAYHNQYESLKRDFIKLQTDYRTEISDLSEARQTLITDTKDLHEKMSKLMEEQRRKMNDTGEENPGKRAIEDKVLLLYSQSFDAYSERDYQKAMQLISKAIQLDPYSSMLYVRLGSIYYEMGIEDLAMDSWETALDLDPDNEEIRRLMSYKSFREQTGPE